MDSLEAIQLAEPADNGIGVVGIDFDPIAAASGLFGGD